MIEITITALIILVVILGYTTFNLLRKLEKYEEVLENDVHYLQGLRKTIQDISIKLDEIDSKGTFESDDEIGWFFKEILLLKEHLSVYGDN